MQRHDIHQDKRYTFNVGNHERYIEINRELSLEEEKQLSAILATFPHAKKL